MAKRGNHYEAAFAAFLQARGVPYVAVDETRRSRLGEASLKNVDFIVSPAAAGRTWLVDVKGRRFPSGGKQYFRNWCTREELRSLAQWETLFGARSCGLLMFAYNVVGDVAPLPRRQLFEHGEAIYGFVGVRLDHYASWARTLSPRWDTVFMPAATFRELARPAEEFFRPVAPVNEVQQRPLIAAP